MLAIDIIQSKSQNQRRRWKRRLGSGHLIQITLLRKVILDLLQIREGTLHLLQIREGTLHLLPMSDSRSLQKEISQVPLLRPKESKRVNKKRFDSIDSSKPRRAKKTRKRHDSTSSERPKSSKKPSKVAKNNKKTKKRQISDNDDGVSSVDKSNQSGNESGTDSSKWKMKKRIKKRKKIDKSKRSEGTSSGKYNNYRLAYQ